MKPILFNTNMVRAILDGQKTVTRRVVKPQPALFGPNIFDWRAMKMPYRRSDILYVRETFFEYKGMYRYKADGNHLALNALIGGKEFFKWRPSIHMPKEAARIFLRVTNMRVERLQDITPEQIDAEGCKEYGYSAKTGELMPSSPVYFSIAWDGTIKPTDILLYGWAANPWVWVIEFERISKEEALQNE